MHFKLSYCIVVDTALCNCFEPRMKSKKMLISWYNWPRTEEISTASSTLTQYSLIHTLSQPFSVLTLHVESEKIVAACRHHNIAYYSALILTNIRKRHIFLAFIVVYLHCKISDKCREILCVYYWNAGNRTSWQWKWSTGCLEVKFVT